MKEKIRSYHHGVEPSLQGLKEVRAMEYVRFRGVDQQEGAHIDKNGVVKMLRRNSRDWRKESEKSGGTSDLTGQMEPDLAP